MDQGLNRRIGRLARVCVAVARGGDGLIRRETREALRAGVAAEEVAEAMLQTHLFAGFPRAINGLWILDELAPDRRRAGQESPGRRGRGERLCRRIYGRDYAPMMRRMNRLHPDLARWILEDGYGKVLSRPAFGARERELMVIATLAEVRAWRQLPSHVRGALLVGATKPEVRRVVREARSLLGSRASGRVLSILEAL